jgi:hypothetical protein
MKMSLDREERRMWGLAVLLAAIVFAGLLLLFRMPEQATKPATESAHTALQGGITMGLTRLDPVSGDALLNEEAMLFDPTPMFLPTEWNVGRKALPNNLIRHTDRVFENYNPKLTFSEVGLALAFPAVIEVPTKVSEALALLEPQQPFLGIGRTDPSIQNLTGRGARVEVISASDGHQIMSLVVPVDQLTLSVWRPLEFLLAVDAAGLIGPPAIMNRSGDERLDLYIQDLLVNTLRIGGRLSPGVYRVCVGP